jgi:hypothetical protein
MHKFTFLLIDFTKKCSITRMNSKYFPTLFNPKAGDNFIRFDLAAPSSSKTLLFCNKKMLYVGQPI